MPNVFGDRYIGHDIATFTKFWILGLPCPSFFADQGQIWRVSVNPWTIGLLFHAKFHLDPFILSPQRGDKPQISQIFKFNFLVAPLRGAHRYACATTNLPLSSDRPINYYTAFIHQTKNGSIIIVSELCLMAIPHPQTSPYRSSVSAASFRSKVIVQPNRQTHIGLIALYEPLQC